MGVESVCHCSVVRYVPDPSRNEPRNIGVLVVCPAAGDARGRFSLSRTYLEPTSISCNLARSYCSKYSRFLSSRSLWRRSALAGEQPLAHR